MIQGQVTNFTSIYSKTSPRAKSFQHLALLHPLLLAVTSSISGIIFALICHYQLQYIIFKPLDRNPRN